MHTLSVPEVLICCRVKVAAYSAVAPADGSSACRRQPYKPLKQAVHASHRQSRPLAQVGDSHEANSIFDEAHPSHYSPILRQDGHAGEEKLIQQLRLNLGTACFVKELLLQLGPLPPEHVRQPYGMARQLIDGYPDKGGQTSGPKTYAHQMMMTMLLDTHGVAALGIHVGRPDQLRLRGRIGPDANVRAVEDKDDIRPRVAEDQLFQALGRPARPVEEPVAFHERTQWDAGKSDRKS